MAAFLYQTKGGTTPDRKLRVYFTCHPNDFEMTFGRVCDDILGVCDCAIYYTEKMEARISNEDKELGLKRMNLFVVPVTRNLLSTANRAILIKRQWNCARLYRNWMQPQNLRMFKS